MTTLRAIQFLLVTMLLHSCQSQTDLGLMPLNQDADVLIVQRDKYSADEVHPATGLTALYIYEIDSFLFAGYDLKTGAADGLNQNSAGFFLKEPFKQGENPIVGTLVEYNSAHEALFEALQSKYGIPETLQEVPEPNEEGIRNGGESYLWEPDADTVILLSRFYNLENGKQNIQTSIYRVLKNVKDQTYPERTAAERLRQTFSN